METNIYAKFKILFRRLFEEKYYMSSHHAERLLKCLEDPYDGSKWLCRRCDMEDEYIYEECSSPKIKLQIYLAKHVVSTPNFPDLIFNSIMSIQKLTLPNQTLILKVATVLFRNELQFNKLQCDGFDLALVKNCMLDNLECKTPSYELHSAYIKLVNVLISHGSGLKSTLAKNAWERVLNSRLHRWPAHVSKSVYEYLSKLIWKLDEYEEEMAIINILRAILEPIEHSEFQTQIIIDIDKEESFSGTLKAPLHAILTILDDMERVSKAKCFIPAFGQCYYMPGKIQNVWVGSRNSEINSALSFINLKFRFAISRKTAVAAGKSESDFLNEIIVSYINCVSMYMLSKKQMVAAILEFVIDVNLFWARTGSKLFQSTFERDGLKYEMEDQFLCLVMVPMITYVRASVGTATAGMDENCEKMGQMHTEHITKCGYSFKMLLERHDLKTITIQNLKHLFKMKDVLKAKQAGTLYQCLFYLLQTFIVKGGAGAFNETPHNPLETYDDVKMLSLTLSAIKMLLTEHHINRYENFEIICIQNGLMDLLKQNDLPTKQLLQVLDLIELSIKQFLSPVLTLLVENRHGGALCELAAVMPRLLRYEFWEVRDCALSLLLACTDIAFVKYVPLQKLISENQLVVLASQAALSDPEFYVQTTALKCLAAAARIESMWRDLLDHNPNVYKHVFHIVQHSPEGMVRTEAVRVLTEVYINQNTSKVFENCIRHVMFSAALDDLHWEVQMEAIFFWKQVIKKHFNDRGLIDGKFPKYTFSKEKRKIIVLDEKEVQRQLTNIMNDLSACGCLTVLHGCLKEEYNVEVMRRARCVSNKLIQTLTCHKFYRVPDNDEVEDREPYTEQKMDVPLDLTVTSSYEEPMVGVPLDLTFVSSNKNNRDSVLDEIVNAKTGDLITLLNQEYAIPNSKHGIIQPRRRERVTPNKFLDDFKQIDYENIIDNMVNWKLDPANLEAILDEILEGKNLEMSDLCIE